MGIEPTSEAWEASILPLYDARSLLLIIQKDGLLGKTERRRTRPWGFRAVAPGPAGWPGCCGPAIAPESFR